MRRHGNRLGSWVAAPRARARAHRRHLGLPRLLAGGAAPAEHRRREYTYTLETLIDAARKRLVDRRGAGSRVARGRRRVADDALGRRLHPPHRLPGDEEPAQRDRLGGVRAGRARGDVVSLALRGRASSCAYHADGAGRHLPGLLASLVLCADRRSGCSSPRLLADGIDTSPAAARGGAVLGAQARAEPARRVNDAYGARLDAELG